MQFIVIFAREIELRSPKGERIYLWLRISSKASSMQLNGSLIDLIHRLS